MLKSIEVQGRTEEEAIEIALEQLKLSRDDVSVEILETAKTGLFGLKNTPAVIKVEYESDEPDAAPEAAPEATASKRSTAKAAASAPIDGQVIENTESYLNGLFERMGIDVELETSEEDGNLSIVLKTVDAGGLIGRRGETLDALQHLTNYSINRGSSNRVRVHLDTENYRQRRSEALKGLATRTAAKVLKFRRNITLDPMNAYERHIIHAALQDNDQVSTFSVGNDNARRVVIAYGQNKTAQERADAPRFKEWH